MKKMKMNQKDQHVQTHLKKGVKQYDEIGFVLTRFEITLAHVSNMLHTANDLATTTTITTVLAALAGATPPSSAATFTATGPPLWLMVSTNR